jgi:hypothetical protein
VHPHLALGVRDAAQIGDDHGGSLEALEAQEGIADDRVGDPSVVRRHEWSDAAAVPVPAELVL